MILMYHNIGESPDFNTVSANAFREQLSYFNDNWNVVAFSEYLGEISRNGISGDMAVITFDDGYTGFRDVALPIIESRELPVTIFIPVDCLGGHNAWDDNHPRGIPLRIMDQSTVSSLAGHPLLTFGSHGMTHQRLSLLSHASIESEITDSKRILSEMIGGPVEIFSYPWGQMWDYNRRIIQMLQEAGYHAACTTRFGGRNDRNNLYELRRIEVEPTDTLNRLVKKCGMKIHFRQTIKELLNRMRLYRPIT